MTRQYGDIDGNSQIRRRNGSWDNPGYDLLLSEEDNALFEIIGEYMRGEIDLEEVINDPLAYEADNIAREIISGYNPDAVNHADSRKFIMDSLAGSSMEEIIAGDINAVTKEIKHSKVNEITADWVREWIDKGQENNGKDSKTGKIRDFITSSLEDKRPEAEILLPVKGKGLTRSLLVRYISLSAAAVAAVIILINSLIPSSDPARLYDAFYEPFNIVSPVTRNTNQSEQKIITDAINYYNTGDYNQAAMGFSASLSQDTSDISLRFYLGITHLALGNNDRAIDLLDGVSAASGKYRKEAWWYSGLACLQSGEKEKASGYFKSLSQLPGFYSERSEKILRRLK